MSDIAPATAPSRLRTAAVIPAYNEAGRITTVLKTAAASRLLDEIIVVTDGCSDSTADEARGFAALLEKRAVRGARCTAMNVFELEQNLGKGGALTYGAHRTEADIVLFLDADLIGLSTEQVDAILEPMLDADPAQRADMTLGLFEGARGGPFGWCLTMIHRNAPNYTGQRAIRREVYLAIPNLTQSRFGVERAMTRYVKNAWKLRVKHVSLYGVTHPCKEEKRGLARGFFQRTKMYCEIAIYMAVDGVRENTSPERRREARALRQQFSDKS